MLNEPTGKNYFLGIGIDEYRFTTPLNNAVKDIGDIFNSIKSRYTFNDSEAVLLFDQEATRGRILNQLVEYETVLTEDDNLIIIYSGHGHLKRGEVGYWVPVEAKQKNTSEYISNSDILVGIRYIKARHIVIISDSCFSGSLFVNENFKNDGNLQTYDDLYAIKSRWALCSGRHDEQVSDGPQGGNSPFAKAIIGLLNENKSSNHSIIDLSQKVIFQTRKTYKNQLPKGAPLNIPGNNGGQFILKLREDVIAWNRLFEKTEPTSKDYNVFINKYPDSIYQKEAIEKRHDLQDDENYIQSEKIDTVDSYQNYINSNLIIKKHKKIAEAKIETIRENDKNAWNKVIDNIEKSIQEYENKFPKGDNLQLAIQLRQNLISKTANVVSQTFPINEIFQEEEIPNVKENNHINENIQVEVNPLINVNSEVINKNEYEKINGLKKLNTVKITSKNLKTPSLDWKKIIESSKFKFSLIVISLCIISFSIFNYITKVTPPRINEKIVQNGVFEKNGAFGYIYNGHVTIPAIYDSIVDIGNERLSLSQNNIFLLAKKSDGHIYNGKEFDGITKYEENFSIVKLNGKYSFIDTIGNLIFPIVFDKVQNFENTKATVWHDDNTMILDKNGNFIFKQEKDKGLIIIQDSLYSTIFLAGNIWMSKNLNSKVRKSRCHTNINDCSSYGRLYTWNAAFNACPKGWTLPTKENFERLIQAYDKIDLMTSGNSEFNAQYHGRITNLSNMLITEIGSRGDFWTSTTADEYSNSAFAFRFDDELRRIPSYANDVDLYFGCRCIKEE